MLTFIGTINARRGISPAARTRRTRLLRFYSISKVVFSLFVAAGVEGCRQDCQVRAARAFHFRCIFTVGRQAETLGYETAGYFNSRVEMVPCALPLGHAV